MGEEVFGPSTVVVRCSSRQELEGVARQLDGQLTATIHGTPADLDEYAWLVSILQHVRLNRLRKQGRTVIDSTLDERVANVVPFVPPIPDHVTDEDMLLALQQIPPHHQEVILLCDVEDMTYKEIAAALEVPIGTVMSRLHRGRELLRTALSRRGAGPAAIGRGTERR